MKLRQSLGKLLLSCLAFMLLVCPAVFATDGTNPYYSEAGLNTSPSLMNLNGQPADYISLYIDQDGRTMVCLYDVVMLFSCHLEYPGQGLLLLHHLDEEQIYSSEQYLCSGQIDEYTPLQRLEAVYLPLKDVAFGFDYQLIYKEQGSVFYLLSPAFQKANPDFLAAPKDEEKEPSSPPEDLPNWGPLNDELAPYWDGEQIIGAYYTKLINSPEGRTNNIVLSCAKLNGKILQSGEVLSFNRTVGQRTIEAGYKEAKIFVGQTVQNGLGGGICQTSTTLYNAGLEAGLKVIERYRHTLPVTYCPSGQDATVSWGGADLKLKNTLGRPVKVLCCVYGDYVMAAFTEVGVK
ncbi:MAG: VanW family protein [Syntrophomonadaceae bacterium]